MNTVQSGGHANTVRKKDSQFEELTVSSTEKKNWRGIFIALLVIVAVLGLILFSIFLLTPDLEFSKFIGRKIQLSDLEDNELQWDNWKGKWLSDDKLIFMNDNDGINFLFVNNMTIQKIISNVTLKQLQIEDFSISPDLNFILVQSNSEENKKFYIYDTKTGHLSPLSPLEGEDEIPNLHSAIWAPVHEVFNATAKAKTVSQGIAFTYENDIYYKPKVQNDLLCRITSTGNDHKILNGVPDWLYSNTQELRGPTMAFSLDGKYLSYLSFNISDVELYNYSWIGEVSGYPSIKSIKYPRPNTHNPNVTVYVTNLSVLKVSFPQPIVLPKIIQGNSYVSGMKWITATDLCITYLKRDQTISFTLICKAPNFICYEIHSEKMTDINWIYPNDNIIFLFPTLNNKLSSHRMEQNVFNDYLPLNTNNTMASAATAAAAATASASASTSSSSTHSTHSTHSSHSTHSTHSIHSSPPTTPTARHHKQHLFIFKRTALRSDSELNGYYKQIVAYSASNRKSTVLTSGKFEVTNIIDFDTANKILYFMATPFDKSGERHLYHIELNITNLDDKIVLSANSAVCITCKRLNDTRASAWSTATSLDTYQYLASKIINKSNNNNTNNFDSTDNKINTNIQKCLYNNIYFSTKFTYFVQECMGRDFPYIHLVDKQKEMKLLQFSNGRIMRQKLLEFALPKQISFNVEIKHGYNARVRLFFPPGMNEDDDVAYPLILNINAYPGSQIISEAYSFDWNWYLSSQKNFIVAQIDARGSGHSGATQVKGKIGIAEVEDQLSVLTYIRDRFKFIDRDKVCAYGWGYGGYISAMLLAEDSKNILKCGIAIAPIVSFKYYSSFFCERYFFFGAGYENSLQTSDLTFQAPKFMNKNFFLIHGSADTTIHFYHSLIMAKALVQQGVLFRHQVYADENHELSNVKNHLYKTLEKYIDESFGIFPPTFD